MNFDWVKYETGAKYMSDEELEYAIKDCVESRDANEGWNPKKWCFYQDEITVYKNELSSRRDQK